VVSGKKIEVLFFFASKATTLTKYLYFNIVNGKAMEIQQITGQHPEIITVKISPLSSLHAILVVF